MKKYVKPEMFFEQFELSQHIADCMLEYSDFRDDKSCIAYTDSDYFGSSYPVFAAENTKCAETIEGYCYTGGTGGINTFLS